MRPGPNAPSRKPRTRRTGPGLRRGPSRPTGPTSRRLAYAAIEAYLSRGAFVGHVLADQMQRGDIDRRDRSLATELANGVVRRRATLETILDSYLRRPAEELETGLRALLMLGAYQLLLLESVPPHAAVHETVGVAHQIGMPRWAGFLNAVLRTLQSDLTDEMTATLASDTIPLNGRNDDPAVRARRVNKPLLPDPEENQAAYLAAAFSYPEWITARWLELSGWDEAVRLCNWFNSPGMMGLRVNLLRTDREKVLDVLRTAGVEATEGAFPESIRLPGTIRVEDIPGFAEGWFSVQDESAMHAARLLDPKVGESIWDVCAAPGGKTAHMAELISCEGRIFSTDVDAGRLQQVEGNIRRLGLRAIEIMQVSADLSDVPQRLFDAVLVDVPCSNSGVLGKRPEARWRMEPDHLRELAVTQRRLLAAAMAHAKPRGRVVYSTCSMFPDENAELVRDVLIRQDIWRIEKEQIHVPGQPGDGSYQALLVRNTDS
ncbi:transcription antitermination factor NusB [Maioricimonas rarisocia]|nr:transcription antitermination factor NusB [Maioricimonas rarisocia]